MFMCLTHRLIYDCFVLDFCKVWGRLIHQIQNTEKKSPPFVQKIGTDLHTEKYGTCILISTQTPGFTTGFTYCSLVALSGKQLL